MHAQIGSSTLALKGSLAVGVVSVVMTFLCAYLVDRFGRKPLLLWSLAGIFVSLSSIALSFCLTPSFLPWLVVSFFMLYIAFFSLGLGPLPWLLISEIFPEEIRCLYIARGDYLFICFVKQPLSFWHKSPYRGGFDNFSKGVQPGSG